MSPAAHFVENHLHHTLILVNVYVRCTHVGEAQGQLSAKPWIHKPGTEQDTPPAK
jgi:hypothetical protein